MRSILSELGFDGVEPAATGRPSYHPSILLKLYIYGYLNRVQSSRRLEREAGRDLEVLWLLGRLVPDHKTIADSRRDNGKPLKKSLRDVRRVVPRDRTEGDGELVIESSSKFKAVNNRDKNFTKGKVDRRPPPAARRKRRARFEPTRYCRPAEPTRRGDKDEAAQREAREAERGNWKVATYEKPMLASPDEQISLTDPYSRSMATSGRGSGVVGYNVQVAVDTEHHLIITHEVTNSGSDRAQLANMAEQARTVLQTDKLEAIADRGYFDSPEILACHEAGITVTLPKPLTSGAKADGRFGKQDFVYLPDEDVYRCPAGERLKYRYTNVENGLTLRSYWRNACRELCDQASLCTTGKGAPHHAMGA